MLLANRALWRLNPVSLPLARGFRNEAGVHSQRELGKRGWRRSDYLKQTISARVYNVAHETPLQRASTLSARLNNEILLKREDLQPVFSFKLRGAYNKVFLFLRGLLMI